MVKLEFNGRDISIGGILIADMGAQNAERAQQHCEIVVAELAIALKKAGVK